MPRRKVALLWDYFTVTDRYMKNATCNFCNRSFSYKTTISNLKHHLKRKHLRAYNDFLERTNEGRPNPSAPTLKWSKNKRSDMWKYFIRSNRQAKSAHCIICRKTLSYKTTTGNLKSHLKTKHHHVYKKLVRHTASLQEKLSSAAPEQGDSDDESESAKQEDLWAYFERDGDRARCVVCDVTLDGCGPDELKAHFQESHPKLVEQLVIQEHKLDAASEASSGAEDGFTEVVYLDRDSSPEPVHRQNVHKTHTRLANDTNRSSFRHKKRQAPYKTPIKREVSDSLSSEELPTSRPRPDEDDELTSFTAYITCLLKKLPPNVFGKVQLDIVNVILNARSKYESNGFDNGCLVLDGKQLVQSGVAIDVHDVSNTSGSLPHNYSITVAPCAQRTDNS